MRAINIAIHAICALTLLTATCGCVTTAPTQGKNASTYLVGDRAGVIFEEIVVSLPFQNGNSAYQNLHIVTAAVVNVKRTTFSDVYEVEEILQRLQPRIAARVTEALDNSGAQGLRNHATLRRTAAGEAQRVVDEAMSQWAHGPDFQVEIVVTSLYWTDPSVGRQLRQNRWQW